MNVMFVDYAPIEQCANIEHSYGEICVKCNKCGRFNKESSEEKENE